MTENEFSTIKGSRALIEENLDADPAALALRLKCPGEQARAVCTQVKYLQRARVKLPSYHAARCVLPPLAFEQCSGEAAAAGKDASGGLCIDLTCGLGVDSFHFSRRFERVVSVERDGVLARVAEYNFGLLGAENITVVNAAAEDFLASYSGGRASLIFVDPARRGREGAKLVLVQDCSPDVVALMPSMMEKAEKVLIKLSPMFDVEEALSVFSPYVSRVETVSSAGECKELLVELSEDEPSVSVNITGNNRYIFTREDIGRRREDAVDPGSLAGKFLIIPDAGFYKSRLTVALSEKYFPEISVLSHDGFCVADSVPEGFPGRAFKIVSAEEYRPARLKKQLKESGVKRMNVIRRNFPHSSAEICRALGVAEGGRVNMAFTKISGKAYAMRLSAI